ncbi:hypothetical protein TNIN_146261 [Trichonephila inaurata madagascariensis]|uniref:Uncharacterized protein n=1 Tax=Trichonephila inaurata madagascariensis TaxID=2747483 RepID=A0A8X6YVE1_9ARAC|nr:hypothetical protein TNIN_146261 [Trichonephila inaurata madagascariensis]
MVLDFGPPELLYKSSTFYIIETESNGSFQQNHKYPKNESSKNFRMESSHPMNQPHRLMSAKLPQVVITGLSPFQQWTFRTAPQNDSGKLETHKLLTVQKYYWS